MEVACKYAATAARSKLESLEKTISDRVLNWDLGMLGLAIGSGTNVSFLGSFHYLQVLDMTCFVNCIPKL